MSSVLGMVVDGRVGRRGGIEVGPLVVEVGGWP